MASSPTSTVASQNPFADSSTTGTSTLQHVNIRTHVTISLDYRDTTFSSWRTVFDTTFRKFGILDHIDSTIDAQAT
jgi:hypothetical protein